MRSGQQLFRIGPNTVFKARAEGILRLLEHSAVGGNCALSVFQSALPNCRAFSLHDCSPFSQCLCWNLGVRFSAASQGYIQYSDPVEARACFAWPRVAFSADKWLMFWLTR